MNKLDWKGYETKYNTYVGEHLQEVNLQAASAARQAEADDGDYSLAN